MLKNKKPKMWKMAVTLLMLALIVEGVGAIEIGTIAPDFKLKDAISGDVISLTELRGRVVLLDFFATWCGPCRRAINDTITPLYNQYYINDPDVVFLSIVCWEPEITAQELQAFATTYNMGWTILLSSDDIAKVYGVDSVPTIVIIDRAGVIRYWHMGCPSFDVLKNEIDILIEKPTPTSEVTPATTLTPMITAPIPTPTEEPGFEVVLALAGITVALYLVMKREKK